MRLKLTCTTFTEDSNEDIDDKSLNTLGKCVCRIRCDSKKYDASQPYNKMDDSSGTGTGFLLEGEKLYIYTAHHVISNHVDIGVYFDAISQGERFEVEVLGFNPHLDVAILKINEDNLTKEQKVLLNSIDKFKIGESDNIKQGENITALGYALGAPHLQISAGIISGRICDPNRLQTDAQINPGNSGGPIVNSENKVVGLVTSGIMFAQGINYATPFKEILILKDRLLKCSNGPCRDVGYSFNCVFRRLSQDTLKLSYFHVDCKSGVLVSGVHKKSKSLLKEGDVLCGIKEAGSDKFYEIDMHGNINIPKIWSDTKLHFKVLLDRIEDVQHLTVKVFRNGHEEPIELNTPVEKSFFAYKEIYPDTEEITYFCDGGIVLQMLNENLISYTGLGENYIKSPEIEMYSNVVVSHVIGASPFSKSDIIQSGQSVKALITSDGKEIEVKSLECVAENWKKILESGIVTILLRNGSMISALTKDILSFNENVDNERKHGLHTKLFP